MVGAALEGREQRKRRRTEVYLTGHLIHHTDRDIKLHDGQPPDASSHCLILLGNFLRFDGETSAMIYRLHAHKEVQDVEASHVSLAEPLYMNGISFSCQVNPCHLR